MFLKNRNISFKIKRSKVTDYAALMLNSKKSFLWAYSVNSLVFFSIFTESLSCLMRSSDANNTCSAVDIAPAVRRSLQITRYLLPEAFPGANVSQTNISWTECDGKFM